MLCDFCGVSPAMIHLEGEGDFCLDCYIERMVSRSRSAGESLSCPTEAAFMDKDGRTHFFELSHVSLGNTISWQARETGGEYEIVMYASPDDPVAGQISRFYRKIADTLWNRTLEVSSSRWGSFESLRDHGNVDIQCSAGTGKVSLVIDGKRFSLEEFGRLLEPYEGWTLQYQMRSKGEDRVRETEFLIPIELTREALLHDLREAIFTFSDSRNIDDVQFISYRNTNALQEAIFRVTDKLELLCGKWPLEEAVKTGEEMIEILRETETDDDSFPEYEISVIEEIIYRFWPRPEKG